MSDNGKERGRVFFDVTPEYLATALHMPDTAKIEHIEWRYDLGHRWIRIYATDEGLPQAPEGGQIPAVTPTVDEEDGWDWDVS